MPVANALWVGPAVGPIEAACLKSFAAVGQRIVLHCYDTPANVPPNVELADANLTVRKELVFRHKGTGSYGHFSDLFRYALLQRGADLYVDCDVFCLRPIDGEDYLFGRHSDQEIAVGVLMLPPGSAVLNDLMRYAGDPKTVPPWISKPVAEKMQTRIAAGTGNALADLPWAVYGPPALTWAARQHGLTHLAREADVFYPVHFRRLRAYLDPGLRVRDLVTPRTVALHLYTSSLDKMVKDGVPPGSPLADLIGR